MNRFCPICRHPFVDGLRGIINETVETDCPPCQNAVENLQQGSGVRADPEYVYHEIAHHIILYRTVPWKSVGFDDLDVAIDKKTIGRQQLHELRTLALQHVTYKTLGWATSKRRFVLNSWPGIADVGAGNGNVRAYPFGQNVVPSLRNAHKRMTEFVQCVSLRNVALMRRALAEWRNGRHPVQGIISI